MGIESIFGLDRNWQPDISTIPKFLGYIAHSMIVPGRMTARFYGIKQSDVACYKTASVGTPSLPNEQARALRIQEVERVWHDDLIVTLMLDVAKTAVIGTAFYLFYRAMS